MMVAMTNHQRRQRRGRRQDEDEDEDRDHQELPNNRFNNNNNNNNNNNGWQSLLNIILLVYSLSLQLGIFDKLNIGGSDGRRGMRNAPGAVTDSTFDDNFDHHHRRRHPHPYPLPRQQQHQPGQSKMARTRSSSSSTTAYHHEQQQQQQQQQQQDESMWRQRRKVEDKEEGNVNNTATLETAPMDEEEEEYNTNENIDTTTFLMENKIIMEQDEINAITSMEGRLRATLLTDYDKNSYPWEWVWAQDFNFTDRDQNGTATKEEVRTGLPVEFGLNFHKVHALDIAASTADLVVWVRIQWKDPRLVWDPKDFGGLTTTWFFLSDGMGGGEVSEIFTPDMYLWNQEEPMEQTLANTYATVSSDGTVFWSRPGRLKATCKYEGLKHFPFDKLGCLLEFGSWSHSGLYLRPTKLGDDGYSVGGSNTAGSSYVQFHLVDDEVKVTELIYPPFPCCPEEDWPVLIYHVKFQRASEPYIRTVVLTNILLNIGAFACFWMSPLSGERMGLAITCVLAAVASEWIVAAMFPICEELSWYNIFSLGSMVFAMVVVFETALVTYFFFYTGTDLTPSYVKFFQKKSKEEEDQIGEEDRTEDDNSNRAMDNSRKDDTVKTRDLLKSSRYPSFPSLNGDNDDSVDDFSGRTREERQLTVKRVADDKCKTREKKHMDEYWQTIAGYIDEGARVILPLLYCVFLGCVFQNRSNE